MLAPQKRAPQRTTLAPPQEQISHLRQKSKDGRKIMSLKLINWSFRNQRLAQGKIGSDTCGNLGILLTATTEDRQEKKKRE